MTAFVRFWNKMLSSHRLKKFKMPIFQNHSNIRLQKFSHLSQVWPIRWNTVKPETWGSRAGRALNIWIFRALNCTDTGCWNRGVVYYACSVLLSVLSNDSSFPGSGFSGFGLDFENPTLKSYFSKSLRDWGGYCTATWSNFSALITESVKWWMMKPVLPFNTQWL